MPPGYFESHSARALFQPKPEETVLQCLQRRIDLLSTVIVDWPNGMPGILDGAHEAFDEMGDSSKCRVFNTALYLRNSYTAAVQVMGNGKSWEYAVEQAIDSLSAIGVETYHRSETIKEFHRQFRKYELFEIKRSWALPRRRRHAAVPRAIDGALWCPPVPPRPRPRHSSPRQCRGTGCAGPCPRGTGSICICICIGSEGLHLRLRAG